MVQILQRVEPYMGVIFGFLSALVFVWIYHGFFPTIFLELDVSEKVDGMLLIHLVAENKSRIAARMISAKLQVLEHEISQTMSEWVPFKEEDQRENEKPIAWRKPERVITSTKFIQPGQSIVIERLYRPTAGVAVHVGLQVEVRSFIARLFHRKHNPCFTTTRWILSPTRPSPSLHGTSSAA